MARTAITDNIWEQLQTTMKAHGCHQWKNDRTVMEAILWKLRTGAPWRDIPIELGSWKTAYNRFNRWSKKGLWQNFFLTYEKKLTKNGYSSTEVMYGVINMQVELGVVSIEQLDKAVAECSEFDFVLMDDRQHDLVNAETANRRYDKGSGVKQVCAAIGVDPADSICFGESLNDLPMFGAAGFSVCMGNGGDAAKQSADAVCDSVEAGGLAKAFADFGLLA